MNNPEKTLLAGLDALALPTTLAAPLLTYMALLQQWNQAYNLTAVRNPAEMVPRHLLDSLAVLPYISGPRLLDVGTGAGLPGLPLALARPEWQFVLLDGNRKKTRFVTQAVTELHIPNVEVVAERVADYAPAQPFDTIMSRAVGTLADLVAQTRHLLAPQGYWLAMKGEYPMAEVAALPEQYRIEAHALSVPGLAAHRHVVLIMNPEPRP